jgi:DNA-binding transcriptional regulator YdaS (Cro superfamily)
MPETVIDQIFELEGMREKLMRELKLSKQSMSDWKRKGSVPARHAVAVERITGIAREELCPGFAWGRKRKAR